MPQFALSGPHTGVEARLQAIAADTCVLDAPPVDAEEFPPASPLAQQHTEVKLAARVQTLANAGSIERAEGGFDLNAAGGCRHPTPRARNLNFSLSINS